MAPTIIATSLPFPAFYVIAGENVLVSVQLPLFLDGFSLCLNKMRFDLTSSSTLERIVASGVIECPVRARQSVRVSWNDLNGVL